jgi:hypothetical protein
MTSAHADDNGASAQIDPTPDESRDWLFITGLVVGMIVGAVL